MRFSRRNLLRGSLATSALWPLLDARRAIGQNAPPTRLVVFTTPNGTRNSLFWPTGSETSFQLNKITSPLEKYKSKLTFLKGIRLNDSLQNGALGGTLGSEHARGTGGMLTARPLNSGSEFKSFGNTTSGWGSGQSIDQYLVDKLNPPTPFKSLQLGVHVRDTEVRARISYRATNQPIPPREDPKDVFNTVFGAVAGGSHQLRTGQAAAVEKNGFAHQSMLRTLLPSFPRKRESIFGRRRSISPLGFVESALQAAPSTAAQDRSIGEPHAARNPASPL